MRKIYIQPSTTIRQVNLKRLCEVIGEGSPGDDYVKRNRNELDNKHEDDSSDYGNLW